RPPRRDDSSAGAGQEQHHHTGGGDRGERERLGPGPPLRGEDGGARPREVRPGACSAVEPVGERVDGVAHLGARAADVVLDGGDALRRVVGVRGGGHRSSPVTAAMSFLTLAIVCSGAGGSASSTLRLPTRAATPDAASSTSVTTRAASHTSRTSDSAAIAVITRAPTPYSASSPAAPNMPAPVPTPRALARISCWASCSSCRTSVLICSVRSATSSPVERSE